MIMKLELLRKEFTEKSTIGDFFIDGKRFCYSLEDVVRDIKISGETAIPYGVYEVITNYSNRFKKVMPLIKDVPGFDGIRIHAGNTAENTEGCPLLGYTKDVDFVGKSNKAFYDFFVLLQKGLDTGKVFITISKGG